MILILLLKMQYNLKDALRNPIQRNSYILWQALEIALTKGEMIKHFFRKLFVKLCSKPHSLVCLPALLLFNSWKNYLPIPFYSVSSVPCWQEPQAHIKCNLLSAYHFPNLFHLQSKFANWPFKWMTMLKWPQIMYDESFPPFFSLLFFLNWWLLFWNPPWFLLLKIHLIFFGSA